MKIALKNFQSKVTELNDKEDEFLDKLLTARVPNYQYMPAFKSKQWDGKKHFYSAVTKTFTSGFLPFIVEQAVKKRIVIEIDDLRDMPHISDPTFIREKYKHLRDYQLQGLIKGATNTLTINNTVVPWQRGFYKMQTGSGKTLVAQALIDFLHQKTLYVVERKQLMYQTHKVFQGRTDMSLGLLGDGHEDLDKDITFATVQTIRSKMQKLGKFFLNIGTLVIDETHHLAQGHYHKISGRCNNAPFRFGFSGTPLQRGDLGDAYLVADTSEMLFESDREELEKDGFLAKPKIYMFSVNEPASQGLSYQKAYKSFIVENDLQNRMIVRATQKLRRKDDTVLILVRMIEHGKTLERLLRKQDIKCLFLKGSDGIKLRQEAVEALGKQYHVLIASSIFDEGVDVPLFNVLIRAGGGESQIKSNQQIGRILRPNPNGDNTVKVVDFVDKTNKFLLKHSAQRIAAYEQEGFTMFFPAKV